MESRINKLANITGNGPQCPSETTWSLSIMMLRNWKSIFFFFLESNKKSNARLLKQMRRCPRNNSIFFFGLNMLVFYMQQNKLKVPIKLHTDVFYVALSNQIK